MTDIHVYNYNGMGDELRDKLTSIELTLRGLRRDIQSLRGAVNERMLDVEAALAELEAEVSRNTSVDESANILLARLADLVEQNAGNPEALMALAGRMRSSTDSLAAAVTAHTPAETPVEPEPPVS